jgi:shikimate dehydrogenase
VLGIIGYPISHSLSPVMQNAALTALGLNAVFVPFAVEPAQLTPAIAGLKALGVCGFNVTVPHKEAILPLLDEIDASAALIGAVNTVKLAAGRLIGYNTDAPGFLTSLEAELDISPQGKRVIIIGAGGAARAAIVALAQAGVRSILIANRNLQRAKDLSIEFKESFPAVDMDSIDLASLLASITNQGADLLVNTSSVGLNGTAFPDLELHGVSAMRVYDMVYGTEPTPLIKTALTAGCRAVNGMGMLAAQGELAFRIWLGQDAPPGLMKQTLLQG